MLLCDSLQRHFLKDEKQARKHNNETVPKQYAATTLQNKQNKTKKKHELCGRTVYVLYVHVGVFFFCGCIMASAERGRGKERRSTNTPKGGPQLAASNTSAVLQFLSKGSHAVAGRLNGPLSTS